MSHDMGKKYEWVCGIKLLLYCGHYHCNIYQIWAYSKTFGFNKQVSYQVWVFLYPRYILSSLSMPIARDFMKLNKRLFSESGWFCSEATVYMETIKTEMTTKKLKRNRSVYWEYTSLNCPASRNAQWSLRGAEEDILCKGQLNFAVAKYHL